MKKKFLQSKLIEDFEVLTDNGWKEIVAVHKTIPYDVYTINTENFSLNCADEHVLFNENMSEVFVKNLYINDYIMTINGKEKIIDIVKTIGNESMYDLELDDNSNKRYYTNGILSHNTSYIKHLTTLVLEKEILFVPPSMAEMLSEPSIIPFLMDHKNSILIIEDAERVISDRENNGSSAGVSNILNLTDGILGDCLNIQIIATFNMKKEKIDKALLRKGRLIAEHKFSNLSIDECNSLLKHIGKDNVVYEEMCIGDIYNIDVELFKTTIKETKIGF